MPPQPVRHLRELTRRRVPLQADRNRVINRIGRLLETVTIKLGSVVSNIVGKSGRAILSAMAGGETSPSRLAEQSTGRLKCSREDLEASMQGPYDEHFRWLLRQLLGELEVLDRRVMEVDLRVYEQTADHRDLLVRLMTLPGVDLITAQALISEIGTDMSRFPDAAHLASWAGLCPGNSESAGKRHSGRTRKGNRYLRRILVQSAWAVAHCKDCALTALFLRVASHAGMKKAAVAVAHRILVLAYYIIRDGTRYREEGGDIYDRRNPERTAKRLKRRLEKIGFEVSISRQIRPPQQGPLPGQTCKRCNGWGIACIHVKQQKSPLARNTSS